MDTVQRILEQLQCKNIKPSKMMKDLGFSSGLFSQWKSGQQKPSAEKLQKIAEYLDTSVDYLLGIEEKFSPSYDKTTIQVAEIFQSLDVCDKAKVLTLLAELSSK